MRAIATFLVLIACSACTNPDVVVVEMAALTLSVPTDGEFTQIYRSDRTGTGQPSSHRSVSFKICDQHVTSLPSAQCELHGEFGTWTRLTEPSAGSEFSLLKERPPSAARPQDIELLPLSGGDHRAIRFASPEYAEDSALLRVRSKVWGDDPQLSTTDRGWPVADCDQHPAGGVGCRFGFLVDGTPVVAQWFSPTDQKGINQGQVWDVATDIDRRLRRLVVSSRKQS